jgi:hypothetical protein
MLLLASPFVFVPLLAATMVIGTYVFAYASHCFITVVEQTSAGNDEVVWPDEPFYDWLWKAVYMLWLTALWLGPIALALRAVAAAHAGTGAATQVLVGSATAVWLGFPITLLSSMGGTSRWVLFSPRVVARLLGQRLGSLLLFYLHSGPVLAACAALLYLTFLTPGGAWFVLLTGVGLAAALLVYARQLGRLAHLVEHTRGPAARPPQPAPRRRPRVRATATYDPWSGSAEQNRPRQPSELPPVMSPLEGPIVGYDVRYDDRPAPEQQPPPRRRPPDLDDVPYEIEGSPHQDPPRGPMPKQWMEPTEYEMRLARGGSAPPPPAFPWAAGVYNFPFYQQTLLPLVALGGGLTLLGLMVQVLVELKPS